MLSSRAEKTVNLQTSHVDISIQSNTTIFCHAWWPWISDFCLNATNEQANDVIEPSHDPWTSSDINARRRVDSSFPLHLVQLIFLFQSDHSAGGNPMF